MPALHLNFNMATFAPQDEQLLVSLLDRIPDATVLAVPPSELPHLVKQAVKVRDQGR